MIKRNLNGNFGFTLIELLVVIAIIGILAAVVLVSLDDAREAARISKARAEMKNIHTAMEMLYNDTGLYPHKQNRYCPPEDQADNEIQLSLPAGGLTATDGTYTGWGGPYFSDVIDPWGTPYFMDEDYECTAGAIGCDGIDDSSLPGSVSPHTNSSVLVSCGPNRALNGSLGAAGTSCVYDDDNVVLVFCKK